MKIRSTVAAVAATCLVGVGLVATAAGANAAPGDEIVVNGDFSTGVLAPATSDFSLTTSLNEASSPGNGDMYDPGVYAIATNPGSLHNQWVEDADGNLKMIVNGFTSGVQTVWQQQAASQTCDTPGSTLAYDFNVDAANVLPLDQYSDGGANIEVIINGVSLGSADLTANDGTPVNISGGNIPAVNPMTIQIVNHATVYIGNDFSLDNISLKQVGGCTVPTTFAFPTPTAASCDVAGSLDLTGLLGDRGDWGLSIDPTYTGPGTYTLTATAETGFFFPAPGDPYVRSIQVTVDPATGITQSTNPNAPCYVRPPVVGGLTIGYYKTHPVTEAAWDAVQAAYPNVLGTLPTTWAGTNGAVKALSVSGSTNNGLDMLKAQFIAVALRANAVPAYGTQNVAVPVGTAIDGGTTVTVNQFLADINTGFASLNTKAKITSVQNVLMLISQDDPSVLFI